MPTLGHAEFKLTTETGEFDAGLSKAEQSAKAKSSSIGNMLGPALKGAIGAGMGFAIGELGQSFNQLDGAMAQLSAQTGVTGSDLKGIKGEVIDLSKSNLQSQTAIAGVAENLIAMQDVAAGNKEEVKSLTEQYLKFSTATGLDAVQSVKDFDQVLDVWGLTAADAGAIMDKLVISHQRFGTNVGESSAALSKLGPMFQVLGVDMDTSIGYLNLFEASGIDAATTAGAFSKAVMLLTDNTDMSNKKLALIGQEIGMTSEQFAAFTASSPEEKFNIIAKSIGEIEDPTRRTQVAIDMFGAKAGIKLAQALRESGGSLDEFMISEEEAAGASEKAAHAIESTLTNRLKLLGNQVKGTAMDLTKDFAPALQVVGIMGPKMGAMMGGMVGAFGKIGPMLNPIAIGTKMWAAAQWLLNVAMSANPILLVVVAIVALGAAVYLVIRYWDQILPLLQSVGAAFQKLGQWIMGGVKVAFEWIKDNWPMLAGILLGPLGIFAGMLAGDSFGLRTKLVELFQGMLDSAVGIFGGLGSALMGVWNNNVVPFFTDTIPNFFKDNWVPILVTIFTGIPGLLFMAFRDQIMGAFGTVTSVFTDTIPGFFKGTFIPLLTGIFIGIPAAIFGAFTGAVLSAWNSVTTFFTVDIPNFFKNNWQTILIGVFTGIPGLLIATFRDQFWGAVQGIAGTITGAATNIAGWFMTGLQAIGTQLIALGASIPGLIWQGLESMKGWFLDQIGGLVGELTGKLDPRNWFSLGIVGQGALIPGMLWDGIATTYPQLLANLDVAVAGVEAKLDPQQWHSLSPNECGMKLIELIWGGAQAAFPALNSWLTGSFVPGVLGKLDPRGWFCKTPNECGFDLIQMIWEGAQSAFPALNSWLTGSFVPGLLGKLDPRGWFCKTPTQCGFDMLQMLWEGAQAAFPALNSWLTGSFIPQILGVLDPRSWFGSPGLIMRGESIPDLIWQGILNQKDLVIARVTEWAKSFPDLIGKGLRDGAGALGNAAGDMIGGIVKGIPNPAKIDLPWSVPYEYGGEIAGEIAGGMCAGAPKIYQSADVMMMGAYKGIRNSADFIVNAAQNVGACVAPAVEAGLLMTMGPLMSTVQSDGSDLMTSLSDGVTQATPVAEAAATASGTSVVGAVGAGIAAGMPAVTEAFKWETTVVEDLTWKLGVLQQSHDAIATSITGIKTAIDTAKGSLDYFASAPLVGTQKFSDATFALGQSMDTLQLKINKLELQKLGLDPESKKAKDLDDQIKALGDEMSELRLRASNVQLEESLALDKPQRQIDAMLSTTKELTFQEIVDGITAAQGKLTYLNPLLEEANKLYESQTIDLDALQTSLADHNKLLGDLASALGTLPDDLKGVATALTQDLGTALADVFATKGADSAVTKAQTLFGELAAVLTTGGEQDLIPALQTELNNALALWTGPTGLGGLAPAALAAGTDTATALASGIQIGTPGVLTATQSCLEAFVAGMGGPEALAKMGAVGDAWVQEMSACLGVVRNVAGQSGTDAAVTYVEQLIASFGAQSEPATTALKTLLDQLKLIRDAELSGELSGDALATKLSDTITAAAPAIEAAGKATVTTTGGVMQTEGTAQGQNTADTLMQTLGQAMTGYSGQASQWGGAVVAYCASGMYQYAVGGEARSYVEGTGRALIDGVVAGLDAEQGALYDRIRQIIDSAIQAAQDAAGTASPSTKFARIGGMMGAGLTLGWEHSLSDFLEGMKQLDPLRVGAPDWLRGLKGGSALQPQVAGGGGGKTYNVTIHNPQPMAAEDSIRRRLITFSHLGI